MRNKTYKLQKLENKRYSILAEDMESCYVCKSPFVDIHEIYGGRNRKVSMLNGFCVPLCRDHHEVATKSYGANVLLKIKCQKKFEETHSRDEFMQIIGRNYLED